MYRVLFIIFFLNFPLQLVGLLEHELSIFNLRAQENIYGTITDAAGKPMPYSSIYIADMQKGIIADEQGRYLIAKVPAGHHNIKVSFIGYSTTSEDVAMDGKAIKKDFKLKEETVKLQELMILPNGMDYATFILMQMQKHLKPLKKQIASYDCTTTTIINKRIDLSTLKKKRTIRFALLLFSWAKIFDVMMKYPNLDLTMYENIHFRNGSMKNSPCHVTHVSPQLEPSEIKAIANKDWFMDKNPYDAFYDIVERNIKRLKKGDKNQIKYLGSYQENGKTILIIEFHKTHVEIVDGIYQIRRARYQNATRVMQFEFHEMAPNIYLPTSGHAKYIINFEGYPKGTVNISMGITYSNVKKK